jgi:hypothetical protein
MPVSLGRWLVEIQSAVGTGMILCRIDPLVVDVGISQPGRLLFFAQLFPR